MGVEQILLKVGSGHNMVTIDQWKGMPLTERVNIINADRVQFIANGQPVGIREGLAMIKAMNK